MVSQQPSQIGSEDLAAKIKALGIDSKSEEGRLQEKIAELVSFAQTAVEPSLAIPVSNTALALSSTEWQALVSDFPASELSFRADLNRTLRRAVGLLVLIVEESGLYKVRRVSEHLWRKHLNSLFYLGHSASQVLPELAKLVEGAQVRGLSRKAEHLTQTAQRLRRHVEEISNLNPESLAVKTESLRLDPNWEENRLQELINQLVSFAKTRTEPVSTIPLSNTPLSVSSTEWQALVSDCPAAEESFRVNVNRALRRTIGLLAAIQEETALYKAHLDDKHRWKRHWSSLLYLADSSDKILPELEELGKEADRRNLCTKAEHLAEAVKRLRGHLIEISTLNPQQ